MHRGVDFTKRGTPIMAAGDGKKSLLLEEMAHLGDLLKSSI